MNMSDVAQVDLKPFDIIDFDKYQDGGGTGKSYAPPVEGKYTGKAPMIKDDGTDVLSETNDFRRSAEGYLQLRLDPITIVSSGPENGYTIRFSSFSSKKYQKREGSQVFDFLRACGIAARPKSEAELRQAIKMASGRTFQFALVWEAYNKTADETISGMENFPLKDEADPSKGRQPWIKDEFEEGKRWFANGKVRYFISAIKGNQ